MVADGAGVAVGAEIEAMREAVQVPLIGNGDVKTPDDALRMMRETGCDGVMVGRAAIANPWTLGQIAAAMRRLPIPPEPALPERVDTALEHLRLMIDYESAPLPKLTEGPARMLKTLAGSRDDVDSSDDPEARACRALRGIIPMYIKGAPGAAQLRARLTQCSRYAEFEHLLRDFLLQASQNRTASAIQTP